MHTKDDFFMIGIYYFKNKINGKMYIGQSINVEDRIHAHFLAAKNPNYPHSVLESAIIKYGEENFIAKPYYECSIEELDLYECYCISEFNTLTPNGYNVLQGGQKFHNVTEEIRNLISIRTKEEMKKVPKSVLQTQLGKPRSLETRNKISNTLSGVPKPEGFGVALSVKLKGVPKSLESRKRMSETRKRNKYRWVNNGIDELPVKEINLEHYLLNGYKLGRKKKHSI